jgi:hypothetical protein
MMPQAEGLKSSDVRYDQTAKRQSDASRDLQSVLLLCCSAALCAMWSQSRVQDAQVSLVNRIVGIPSSIGALCSNQVTNLKSLFITHLDQYATQSVFFFRTLKLLVPRFRSYPEYTPLHSRSHCVE